MTDRISPVYLPSNINCAVSYPQLSQGKYKHMFQLNTQGATHTEKLPIKCAWGRPSVHFTKLSLYLNLATHGHVSDIPVETEEVKNTTALQFENWTEFEYSCMTCTTITSAGIQKQNYVENSALCLWGSGTVRHSHLADDCPGCRRLANTGCWMVAIVLNVIIFWPLGVSFEQY